MKWFVLSLFPGIGLLDMAFEEEGFTVARGPDVLWGGDIRRFHPPTSKFDGVIGGPPCQAFSSLAHLVRANGHEPKFGNLIPEFERCVSEAQPDWFLMENVRAAPEPAVFGYTAKSFLMDNSSLNGGDGFGLEQQRLRRFTFGMRGREAVPSLLRWIDLAVFLLPDAKNGLTGSGGGQRRTGIAAVGHGEPPSVRDARVRRLAVLGSTDEVPVKISGSGTGGASARMVRYRLADACRLQGLPEDFLADAPFTAEGKLKAVANGVPLPMGRAVARAIKGAIG